MFLWWNSPQTLKFLFIAFLLPSFSESSTMVACSYCSECPSCITAHSLLQEYSCICHFGTIAAFHPGSNAFEMSRKIQDQLSGRFILYLSQHFAKCSYSGMSFSAIQTCPWHRGLKLPCPDPLNSIPLNLQEPAPLHKGTVVDLEGPWCLALQWNQYFTGRTMVLAEFESVICWYILQIRLEIKTTLHFFL